MANDSTSFFKWYRRYRVRAVDMALFQQSMIDLPTGFSEGSVGAAVLKGFSASVTGPSEVTVSAGISTSATGFLGVINSETTLDVSAASGSLPCRSLLVVRPAPVDENFIPSPTSPFTPVPLNSVQLSELVLIAGIPEATPEYPVKHPNDTILFGIRFGASPSSFDESNLDFEVRESLGVGSLIDQNQVRFDDRLRPYRASSTVLGIKPSQSSGSGPMVFSYPGRTTPSVFPLTAGSFTDADAFADFSTGVISGGDATSAAFAPPVLTSSQSVVCVVQLTSDDTLAFSFGIAGTYAQCMAAIRNQIVGGPGGLPLAGDFQVSYVIVSANAGAISDIQVIDARPFLGSGGGGGGGDFNAETPSGSVNGSNAAFTLSRLPASKKSLFFLVGVNILTVDDFTLLGTQVTITNSDFIPVPPQSVYAIYPLAGSASSASSGYTPHGTPGAPVVLGAGQAVTGSSDRLQTFWLASTGGAMSITAVPQIMPGLTLGDRLLVKGPSGASSGNFVVFHDGDGLDMSGDGDLALTSDQAGEFSWNGSLWSLDYRRK